MVTFTSQSAAETEALGETWGRTVKPGVIIALSGDLGAGKTQLVRGIARGLGHAGRVHSPTFTLVNEYTGGRVNLHHLDLYRLESPDQVIAAGLEPYLDRPKGITVVEWAERWLGETLDNGVQNPNLWRVWIDIINEQERRIRYEGAGV